MKSRHDASLSDASLAAFASMHVDASLSYYLIGECGYANDLWLNTEVATQLCLEKVVVKRNRCNDILLYLS